MTTLGSFWTLVISNKDLITLLIALLGVGLGVLNLSRDILKTRRQERVRLKLVPKLGYAVPGGMFSDKKHIPDTPSAFLVAVVENHSCFPVFIEHLYIECESHPGLESIVFQPSSYPERTFPIRLDRHESVTLFSEKQTVRELVTIGARGVYVRTSTGEKFNGTSEVFKKIFQRYEILPHTELGTVDWEASNRR